MNIIEAINDQEFFKPLFRDLDTWRSWLVVLKCLFGLPMGWRERRLYKKCTGRKKPPDRPFKELWAIIGRRGGKSFIAAVTAVYNALFHDYGQYLGPGEIGVIQVIASDREQAKVILGYIKGILNSNDVFKRYVQNELKESVELTNGIIIEVATCSFRTVRGRTVVCAIFDEIAFWRVEGANPDREILGAVRPSMATIPNAMLLVLSSPYAKVGVLYETRKEYWGKDDPTILVWQCETRRMNPTIDKKLIDREVAKDPTAARAEWFAEFRSDLESYVSRQAVEQCVIRNRVELSPMPGVQYIPFIDPSGGSGKDSMTLAISHTENGIKVLDAVRERKPPFNPTDVVEEFASLLRRYRISAVTGDRFGGEWVRGPFKDYGISYQLAQKPKSDIYRDFLPLLNSGQVELLDNDDLVNQLCGLERRTGRSGKDSIDHAPGQHDDLINVVAGSMVGGDTRVVPRIVFVDPDRPRPAKPQGESKKPKLKPGETEAIPVYVGDKIVRWDIIKPERPRLPGVDGRGGGIGNWGPGRLSD